MTERLAEDHAAFRHWLFADTDYVRGPGTPIFAMAFTEHFRWGRSDFDPPRATFGVTGSDENLPDRFVPNEE